MLAVPLGQGGSRANLPLEIPCKRGSNSEIATGALFPTAAVLGGGGSGGHGEERHALAVGHRPQGPLRPRVTPSRAVFARRAVHVGPPVRAPCRAERAAASSRAARPSGVRACVQVFVKPKYRTEYMAKMVDQVSRSRPGSRTASLAPSWDSPQRRQSGAVPVIARPRRPSPARPHGSPTSAFLHPTRTSPTASGTRTFRSTRRRSSSERPTR